MKDNFLLQINVLLLSRHKIEVTNICKCCMIVPLICWVGIPLILLDTLCWYDSPLMMNLNLVYIWEYKSFYIT